MRRKPLLSILLLPALVAGPAAGQSRSDRFDEQTTVLVVEVPVQVTRDGEPVRGLTADDFEVRSRGTSYPIVGFEVIDLAAVEPAPATVRRAAAAPRLAARRHFMLLFDLSFSDPSSVERARAAARSLLAGGLHATDLVGVATYRASQGTELVLGFTTDRRQLEVALDSLGPAETHRQSRDPLALVLEDPLGSGSVLDGATGLGGQKAERYDAMVEMYRDLQQFQSKDARDRRQNEILGLASSLDQFARLMESVPGRKQVVYFSEGFDSSIVTGSQDMRRLMEIAADAQAGEFWRVDNDERFGSSVAQGALMEMLDRFKRADCAIQAVDIGVLRTGGEIGGRVDGQDGLYLMAAETGGEFYRNFNDLSGAVDQLMERTSVTYLLAIQPEGLQRDGSYQPLKVRLKEEPRGTRLSHRPGFYAPKPFSEQTVAERQINAAGLIMGGAEGGELAASVLAAPFPSGGGVYYVPMILEIDGEALLARSGGEEFWPLEIYAYAIDSTGTVRDFLTQAMRLELAKVGDQLRRSGLRFWGSFDLPPGDYAIRVLVRNAATGDLGLRVQELSVPPGEGRAELSPPLVPDSAADWLFIREPGAQREGQPYPFLLGEQAFIPAARPEVARGAQAPVALVGYHLAPGRLEAEGRLLAWDGSSAGVAELELDPRDPVRTNGFERLSGRLKVGDLPAGDYRLEVTLRSSATGEEQTSSIPVRVVG